MSKYRAVQAPLLILLLSLIVRIATALWLPAQIVWADGERYERVALSLYAGQGFGSLYINSYSVPTQALLIAGVYKVFGQSYEALRLVCAVMGALSCLVGYFIARRLFGSATARIAGLLLALYPYFIYMSALFEYPQVLFMLLIGLFFLCLLRYQESQRPVDVLLGGALFGTAILTVPTILLLVPFMAAFVLWISKTGRFWRALVFVLALSLPVATWAARNYRAYHHFVLVNASSGINFWSSNNNTYYELGKNAVISGCSGDPTENAFCREYIESIVQVLDRNLTEEENRLEWERIYWAKGMDFIRESPIRFLELSVRRFLTFWNPVPDAMTAGASAGGAARNWIAALSFSPILLLGVCGILLSRSRWRSLLPVYAYFLVFMAVYSVFLPATRYRLPLDYFLILFTAWALHTWWRARHRDAQECLAIKSS